VPVGELMVLLIAGAICCGRREFCRKSLGAGVVQVERDLGLTRRARCGSALASNAFTRDSVLSQPWDAAWLATLFS
jgi:hypothetical protein